MGEIVHLSRPLPVIIMGRGFGRKYPTPVPPAGNVSSRAMIPRAIAGKSLGGGPMSACQFPRQTVRVRDLLMLVLMWATLTGLFLPTQAPVSDRTHRPQRFLELSEDRRCRPNDLSLPAPRTRSASARSALRPGRGPRVSPPLFLGNYAPARPSIHRTDLFLLPGPHGSQTCLVGYNRPVCR